jgi:protein-disulfide isomerase
LVFAVLAGCAASAPPPAPASAPVASRATGAAPAAGEEDAAVPIDARNPTWGNRTALVTIVEFADFQCPYCRVGEATMARLRAANGPDTLRVVWKNSPLDFHDQAHPTAEAGAAVFATAGNDAFWKFHHAAFSGQADLGLENSLKWAGDAGVTDLTRLRAELAAHTWATPVDADLAEGQKLGVQGTPTFFVNGIPMVGAQPVEKFQAVIDDQVKAARAKLAAGTSPERLYAVLAGENLAAAAKNAPDGDDGGEEDTKTVFKVPLGSSPARGGAAPLVTIVEFADYQCPYCARAEETVKALREEYGDKLRVVFKDEPLPFHEHAEPAAEAALQVREEKGDAAYWQMHDALFAGQGDLSDDTLIQIAAQLGARPDRVKTAIAKHTHRKAIDDDLSLSDDLQADGTPHFFIDGRRLVGSQPKAKFEAIIDEELKKAADAIAHGTRTEGVYDALTRDGQGPPPPETRDLPASLPAGDPARGNPKAKVVVHEWSDFQCPFCSRVEPTVAELLSEYGNRIRFVWHDLPLPMHPSAPLAAQAAREALRQKGEKGFWAFHDTVFAHQKDLGRDAIDGWGRDLGVDMARWKAALDGATHQPEVEADAKLATDMNINGTPSFVIAVAGAKSGYFLSGAQPYPRFRKLVERALSEAH